MALVRKWSGQPSPPGVFELDAVDARQHIDANWLDTYLENRARAREIRFC